MKIRLSELKQIIKEEVETAGLVSRLNSIDWDYEMSDDYGVYHAGRSAVESVSSLLRKMDKDAADALLTDPSLRPYAKSKVEFILGRK